MEKRNGGIPNRENSTHRHMQALELSCTGEMEGIKSAGKSSKER